MNPKEIERSILIWPEQVKNTEGYLENGITTPCSASPAPTMTSRPIRIQSPGATRVTGGQRTLVCQSPLWTRGRGFGCRAYRNNAGYDEDDAPVPAAVGG